MHSFRCERCGGVFPSTPADDDAARAEFRANFPELVDARFTSRDLAQLCGQCFRDFMVWFRTLAEADKRLIRERFHHQPNARVHGLQ